MILSTSFLWLAPALAPAQTPMTPAQAPGGAPVRGLTFDARAAEHLYNRAGFGAPPAEIRAAVALGAEAFVDGLLSASGETDPPYFAERFSQRDGVRPKDMLPQSDGMDPEAVKEMAATLRAKDRAQLADYSAWWIERMLDGEAALVERMTLFWHGHFTSSFDDVKSSYEMIQQNQLFRRHALGSFRELLHEIARDPAMLEYLDNDDSKKGSPNENFARELLELFTLGEGHYAEQDIQEIARAFTGWTDRSGNFRFARGQHDGGPKTIFGQTGRFDGDQALDLILDQPRCAEFLAEKLLAWFEGVPAEPARAREYAALLRANGYELRPFLRKLFLDPRFYRAEVVGTRIAGPIDYLVGTSRRLGAAPPPLLIGLGARVLGQQLFFPPSVKGWDGGTAWMTTQSYMQRGNFAGLLLGVVEPGDLVAPDDDESAMAPSGEMADEGAMADDGAMEDKGAEKRAEKGADAKPGYSARSKARSDAIRKRLGRGDNPMQQLDRLTKLGWRPRIHLSSRVKAAGAGDASAIVSALADEILAAPLEPETQAHLEQVLAQKCREAGTTPEALLGEVQRSEPILRALAHLLLSLPEAQLD